MTGTEIFSCMTRTKEFSFLFEAKTDLSTSNIYGAIGQLMFHGASEDPSPRKILVVPENPDSQTGSILRRLGIEVLQYVWESGEPAFPGLKRLELAKS